MPRISKNTKRIVFKKTKGICAHCGKRMYSNKTVDHVIPKSLGGGYDTRNLMPVCDKCNKLRGNDIVNPVIFYKYIDRIYIDSFYDYLSEYENQERRISC